MNTLNTLIYSVRELMKQQSDDSTLTDSFIESILLRKRSELIANNYNKPVRVPEALKQNLGCLDLEITDPVECCNLSSGCSIVRTKLKIPTPIELSTRHVITVSPVNNKTQKPYSLIDSDRASVVTSGRYTGNMFYAFYMNDRIYMVSGSDKLQYLQHINIRGLFENPEEAYNFNKCDDTDCFNRDSEFPITNRLVDRLIRLTYDEVLNVLRVPEDKTNDGDNTESAEQIKQK